MEPRSGCAINAAVEALGDQWSFLVLRDIMLEQLDDAYADAMHMAG